MELMIEEGMDDASPNIVIDQAAVAGVGHQDSTTAALLSVADTDTSAGDVTLLHETTTTTSDVAEGEGEADAAVNNYIISDDFSSPINEEAALNHNTDTAAGTANNEGTIEENFTTDAFTSNNYDMDLLGFTNVGGAEMITENQAEISSFPENNNTAESVSNDFDLLGFGVVGEPQEQELPYTNDKTITDANDNEVNTTSTEVGEQNDASNPDSEVVDEAPTKTEEMTSSTDPVPNPVDAVEDDLLNAEMTNDPDSEIVDQEHTETVKTTSSDVPNQSSAVEDLLSLASHEPSATAVTLPESSDDEIDAKDSTQLNSEEVTNINGDVFEATDTQPNDEPLPHVSSSGTKNVVTEEATEGSNNISDANDVDDAETGVEAKIHTFEDMVVLPENTDGAMTTMSEESMQLDVVVNNIDLTPATNIQPNEAVDTDVQEAMHQEEGEEEECGEGFQTVEENNESDMTAALNEVGRNPNISASAEAHTEEEAEWLSMGLSLGDALRQIVALTDERDSALAFCQEKDDIATQADALLVEVQARLEAEMNRRAESDSKARKLLETMKTYEARLEAYEKMEDDLEATQANLVTVVSEKSQLELEIAKLREVRDESERKEAVLSNRLNEAKKKEANKSHTAGRLELDNEELRAKLESTKAELESVSKAKTKLEGTMEKLKTKAVERVKQAETALKEERELNEERKKKMKVFVETKAEELREAKESASDMQKELQETRASLTASREREETIQNELESARIKVREVQRDMERMKRNAEALHDMGNNLEQELEKSANETEEHKKKRISAKHELMTMMRTLEVERGVSEKLRESMKFTFAPKAQSQQQLLSECLRDLEQELDRLSMKLGKSLLPQSQTNDSGPAKIEEGMERSESNGSGKKTRRGRASKADVDTERLISNLEQETQMVSKGIMALVSSIERMRVLLDEDNSFNCMAFLSHFGMAIGTGEARHQRLGGEAPTDDREETMSITSFEQR